MTHSLHRQGTYANLGDDFVVFISPNREIADLQASISKFREIGSRYEPVNVPGVKSQESARHFVYDSREKVSKVLSDLAAADLGISVIVSGLRDQVTECCRDARISPHTVNQSLGFWGKTQLLPDFRVLEITTMCGHGRIPPNLVWELARQVQQHSLGVKEAARKMGQFCICNIFNEVRAARLLGQLVADLEASTIAKPKPNSPNHPNLITIWAELCTKKGIMKKPLIDKEGEVRELTKEDFKRSKPAREVVPEIIKASREGRLRGPQKVPTKVQTTVRLSRDVINFFKSTGRGWQSRIDEALMEYVKDHH